MKIHKALQSASSLLTKKVICRSLALLAAVPLAWGGQINTVGSGNDAGRGEPSVQFEERMAWWTKAKFGMFIHWGIYSVPAQGEWFLKASNMPLEEYEKYARQFDPTQYSPKEFVRIAKDAGMKYIVITAKHHDGFCMFDTKAGDFNIVKRTAYGKDVLKPLSDECRKQGIHFCTYYSITDWHHPSQFKASAASYDPTQMHPELKAGYIAYMKQELKELVQDDHSELIWFDGQWPKWWTREDGQDMYNYLRNLDPKLIINNRVGKGLNGAGKDVGDYGTPEQEIPSHGFPGSYWESCMTINDAWGYNKTDQCWKSPEVLVRNLIDIVSKGGNYLLNIGPTDKGLIPPPEVDVLMAMGAWLKVNGEAIYGCGPTAFETGVAGGAQKVEWRCTTKPHTIYIHLFTWPTKKFELTGVKQTVVKAYLLADPSHTALAINQNGMNLAVTLPEKAPDPIASVLCLETK